MNILALALFVAACVAYVRSQFGWWVLFMGAFLWVSFGKL